MTHYLMSVHGPADYGDYGTYGSQEERERAFAGGLQQATTATVVDGRGDQPLVTDGPYLETKEYIGGFWVIDAPDLDVALELAAAGSKACRGPVEVRPFDGLA